MLTTFTLHISSAFNIHWMPGQLAQVVMRMSMKGTNHETETEGLYPLPNNTVACSFCKHTANIVSTTAIWTIYGKEAVNYG